MRFVGLILSVVLFSTFAAAEQVEKPFELSASDGSGLKLTSLEATGSLLGPLAFTELHLTFENPKNRVIEGRFRITLPEQASISRFAMKIGGRWQEGEVVEKQAARRAYEDFLHRKQDPALLEQAAGNEFRARVFPIPANGKKELIISYAQELHSASAPYVLPLKGLSKVDRLRVVVRGGRKTVEFSRQGFVPNVDVVVEQKAESGSLRSDNLWVGRITPVKSGKTIKLGRTMIAVDTSASRALGYDAYIRKIGELIDELKKGGTTSLQVLAFDQTAQEIYSGDVSGFTRDHLKKLRRRRALGATKVDALVKKLQSDKKIFDSAVLVTDGVFTAGERKGLSLQGIPRVHAIAVGGIRDTAALSSLVNGAVLDGDQPAKLLAQRLQLETRSDLDVVVPGSDWSWPRSLDGVQAGDEVLIFAKFRGAAPKHIEVSRRKISVAKALDVKRPLLERAIARAEIESLDSIRKGLRPTATKELASLKARIVQISTTMRVLSPDTALLVLETEADYRRFGIDRRSLADILSFDGQGNLRLMKRSDFAVAPKPIVKPKPRRKVGVKKSMRRAREGEAERSAAQPKMEPRMVADTEPNLGGSESVAQEMLAAPPPPTAPARRSRHSSQAAMPSEEEAPQDDSVAEKIPDADPWQGQFKTIMQLIEKKKASAALLKARAWREEAPGDVLALVALGRSLAAAGQKEEAARAFGSLIDLFSSRADLLRFAGNLLESLDQKDALALAVSAFEDAVKQRADHPSSHRMLAFALIKDAQPERAFEVLEKSLQRSYPDGRFRGVREILAEDLGLAAASWIRKSPKEAKKIKKRLKKSGGKLENKSSLRFVLTWETDANDVDFHILDAKGGHAYYSNKKLPSGGRLYADVTTGYGPECFTVRKKRSRRSGPYRLRAHYYSRGPMGYGMGKLSVIDHDGKGGFKFSERPFVVMKDGAYLDFGQAR